MDPTLTASSETASTGVGVLDKVVAILDAVESGAGTTAELVGATGIPKPSVIRFTNALEQHGLLGRDGVRRFRLGPKLVSLGAAALSGASYVEALRETSRPALARLSETTGESAQLYVRMGDRRVCVASSASSNELRTIIDVGAALPLTAGSAGKVFLGYVSDRERERLLREIRQLTPSTVTDPERLGRHVDHAKRRGWAQSVEEREAGVASVSAPVLDSFGHLAAVVSVSGPVQRVGRRPGRHYSAAVMHAARSIEQALGFS